MNVYTVVVGFPPSLFWLFFSTGIFRRFAVCVFLHTSFIVWHMLVRHRNHSCVIALGQLFHKCGDAVKWLPSNSQNVRSIFDANIQPNELSVHTDVCVCVFSRWWLVRSPTFVLSIVLDFQWPLSIFLWKHKYAHNHLRAHDFVGFLLLLVYDMASENDFISAVCVWVFLVNREHVLQIVWMQNRCNIRKQK